MNMGGVLWTKKIVKFCESLGKSIYYLAKYLTYFVRRLSALISTSSTVRKNADMNMTDKLNEGAYDYLLR